ncbi:MAG: hypothetical protein AB7S70_00680 [Hyphomicrobium sp.]|uniref:hypothetical protein n=1 Tax=Hyphomicrobium sp. TaxID=82 RepID=UPI003D1261A8
MQEYRNGQSDWPTPSMLLDSLFRIESRIGGLETGQRMTNDLIEASFNRHNETDGLVTRIDERLGRVEAATAPRSPAPTITPTGPQLQAAPPLPAMPTPSAWVSAKEIILALTTFGLSLKDLLVALAGLVGAVWLLLGHSPKPQPFVPPETVIVGPLSVSPGPSSEFLER